MSNLFLGSGMMMSSIKIASAATGMVSTWKTDNVGPTNDDQIKIPVYDGGIYDCTVYWGDGTNDVISTWNDAAWTHTYAGGAGTYTVNIIGQCEGFRFNATGDKTKIVTVESFGADFRLGNLNGYFNGWSNLTEFADDLVMTGTIDIAASWNACSKLTSFPVLDTSSVENFASAWLNCSGLTTFPLLDTSSGTIFGNSWRLCTNLISIPALDMSAATGTFQMFLSCPSLASILSTGFSVSFSVANCDLDSAALDVLYTNLASAAATITVTGNPGIGGDDPSIAEAKGWTVAGS